ncbi:MAG: sigma-54-dependent Fis family transcriptional regulator, partial [Deltaproteobacteria bacterium]|nr:sigma-54-dependent Fis family transcriptional regulator [Deltaproteobacteria bacterium]
KEAIELMRAYSWPGNVRELKNLVERLAIMVKGDIVDVSDMPTHYKPGTMEKTKSFEEQFFLMDYLKDAKRAFEKAFIQRKLLKNKNNISKTAKAIGVKQSYLNKKIKQL